MNIAVRYYSRSGNTKAVAEAIARKAGVEAVSIDQENAPIAEPVDILFIGGALYAYGIDGHLKKYLKTLKKEDVRRAVVFSASVVSRHAIDLIKKGREEVGITSEEEYFHIKGKPVDEQLEEAERFAGKFI